VVYKDSKNKDAAWAFVQFVTDPKIQVKWYQQVTDLPAVQAAWTDPVVSGDANVKVFGDQLKDTQAPPAIPTWNEISTAINDQLEKVTTGATSAEAGAKAMQEKANSIGTGG
jgi:multiple sugar transport system substrate-binding protein